MRRRARPPHPTGARGSGGYRAFLPGLLVAGLGLGLGLAMVALTVGAVPAHEQDGPAEGGAASALYNTALQVGGAVGVAVLAAVADARARAVPAGADLAAQVAALTAGRQLAIAVAAATLVAGAGVALALPASSGRE